MYYRVVEACASKPATLIADILSQFTRMGHKATAAVSDNVLCVN